MSFTKPSVNKTPIVDTVFVIVNKANEAKEKLGDDQVVSATIGSFYTEDGQLAAMPVVYESLKQLDNRKLAKYAADFTGNPDFQKEVKNWVIQGSCDLPCTVIATPGGSGAVSMSIENTLEAGQTLIIPEIAWGSYSLMAQMNNINVTSYSLFKDGKFNLDDFKATCNKVLETQDRLTVVINDPCHNPTGYSMSREEWDSVIDFLNECSKRASVVLINDIAYIDFSPRGMEARKYMEAFNNISDNVAVIICFSISKSMTAYGLRTGAAIILAKTEAGVQEIKTVFEKHARANWSNINNGAMEMFVDIMHNRKDEYDQERAEFVNMLKARTDLFIKEAQEAGLDYYPYKEGFFVTLAMDNETRDKAHQAMMDEQIYTVKVNKGIRVALCSLPLAKVEGLAGRMAEIINSVK